MAVFPVKSSLSLPRRGARRCREEHLDLRLRAAAQRRLQLAARLQGLGAIGDVQPVPGTAQGPREGPEAHLLEPGAEGGHFDAGVAHGGQATSPEAQQEVADLGK